MGNINGKIRIKFSDCELEIEGSEAFVEKQYAKIEPYFRGVKKFPALTATSIEKESKDQSEEKNVITLQTANNLKNGSEISTLFGEWLHKLPSDATDSQTVLYAGFYCQKQDENNTFDGGSVNKLLKDHSIKLSNPSARIKDLLEDKKIFLVEKKGRFPKYRLAREVETEIIANFNE
jgi:hypothetical protein